MKIIPQKDWQWFGDAGHLIVAFNCRFHLCTKIGKYLISTVGAYYPNNSRKDKEEEIGFGRTYETFVFECGEIKCTQKECGMCGLPEISGHELDSEGYNNRGDATRGHYKMCQKFSKNQV